MEVQSIGNTSFAVYLSKSDLTERNIKPGAIKSEEMTEILRAAFKELGRTFCPRTYVELFPGQNELMLFVRLNFKKPVFFCFDDFEEVVSAALASTDSPLSSLFYISGRYILAVYQPEGERDPISFSEFGQKLTFPADYVLHLAEHGQELIANNAVSILREKFVQAF